MHGFVPCALHGHYVAFRWIEVHTPFVSPSLQSNKILLENMLVVGRLHGTVNEGVVSEESHLRVDIVGYIIDIVQKENGLQASTLGYAREDRSGDSGL